MRAGGPAITNGSHIKLGRQGISHGHREAEHDSIERFAPPVDGKQGQFTMVDALLGGVLDPDPPPAWIDTSRNCRASLAARVDLTGTPSPRRGIAETA